MLIDLKPLIQELRPNKIKNKNVVLGILKHGENLDTENYIKSIEVEAEQLEVKTIVQDLEHTYTDISLLKKADFLIPVKPFPLSFETLIKSQIKSYKDVDNFSGKSFYNNCTAEGVLEILRYLKIKPQSRVVIIGRHIGLEIFKLLLKANYSPTICHSKTKNLKLYTQDADVIITATGVKNLITKDMVKANSLVIDVGLGDVEEDVARKAHVTPVRNGVGAVTTQILFKHILEQ